MSSATRSLGDDAGPRPGDGWELPEYQATEFRPRSSRECVCVFVLNEGPRLLAQLERMRPHARDLDIIVADGGSTDGRMTPGALAALGARALLVKTGAGRLSAQMRMALAYALEEGYEGVICMDGNNKDDPSALPRFVAALRDGYDHVQGSRFIPGGREENTPRHRLWAVRLVHAPLISLAAGRRHTDTTNGFRGYSPRLLRDPRVAPFRRVFADYELHYYLAIRASRLALRCIEVPVTRSYPAHGPTPTKISPIAGNLRVLRQLLQACLGVYTPRGAGKAAGGGAQPSVPGGQGQAAAE